MPPFIPTPKPESTPEPVATPDPDPTPDPVKKPPPQVEYFEESAESRGLTAGRWVGSLGGRQFSLHLTGPDDNLRGWIQVSLQQQQARTNVRGRYEPATRTLQLRNAEQDYTLTAVLGPDGKRLRGNASRGTQTMPVNLSRR